MDERQNKNQIFAEKQAISQLTFDVPVESVPLPSKGLLYPPDHALCNAEMVDITAMTAREEDILTSQALIKKGTVITELIKSCLVNKNVDTRDMLTGDRHALMIAIRITGYGSEFDGEIKCEACDKVSSRTFDLGEIPIKRLKLEPTSPNVNSFEFKLPKSGHLVRFRFMTGTIEEEMSTVHEREKKLLNTLLDSYVTKTLFYSILSVNGIEDRGTIAKFVQSMSASDSKALRDHIRTNEPGMIMTRRSECPLCEHDEEVEIPLGVSFFWPKAKRQG